MKEKFYLVSLYLLTAQWVWLLSERWPVHGWAIALVTLFVADAGSYVLHYIVDFYGDADRPGVIHEFQLHHKDPKGIVTAPLSHVLYPAAWIIVPVWATLGTFTAQGYIPPAVALVLAVLGASWGFAQLFHRWAHLRRPPLLIRLLQGMRLIIHPAPHDVHHTPPYATDYAVVTGWSNPVLDALKAPVLIDAILGALGFAKRDQALPEYEGTRV